jgi:predicted amidohydrolase
MHPCELTADQLAALAEPLDGPFARGVCNIARELGIWIAFTMNELRPGTTSARHATQGADGHGAPGPTTVASPLGPTVTGAPPFNTAAIASPDGTICGSYRKCHLYDAHGVFESDRLSSGDELARPIHTSLGTFGMGICYDLRFPEVARALALAGSELLLFPAAWHDGPNKPLHWKTLLRARAIENECFVAGVCHAGTRYVRTSYVFDPLGNELVGGSDDLFTCDIDLDAVRAARYAMPVFSHRRPELYGSLT